MADTNKTYVDASPPKRKVLVRCSFEVEVEFDASMTDHDIEFAIEENSCPGTGSVGAAVSTLFYKNEASGCCEFCAAQGENKLVRFL